MVESADAGISEVNFKYYLYYIILDMSAGKH